MNKNFDDFCMNCCNRRGLHHSGTNACPEIELAKGAYGLVPRHVSYKENSTFKGRLHYGIDCGKLDGEDVNWKYSDVFDTESEAREAIKKAGYPVNRLTMYVSLNVPDRRQVSIDLDTGEITKNH